MYKSAARAVSSLVGTFTEQANVEYQLLKMEQRSLMLMLKLPVA